MKTFGLHAVVILGCMVTAFVVCNLVYPESHEQGKIVLAMGSVLSLIVEGAIKEPTH